MLLALSVLFVSSAILWPVAQFSLTRSTNR